MEKLISELICTDSGQQFNGDDFRSLRKPGVYVLLKEGLPLYIGMSKCLLQRIGFSGHVQAKRAIDECDKVLMYPCRSLAKARRLERILIARMKPAYNHRLSLNPHSPDYPIQQIKHEITVNEVDRLRR